MKPLITFIEDHRLKVDGVVLNVGDGDAIVLLLKKMNTKLLIVIDGGNTNHATRVCNYVKEKCKELKKAGPDLVICTHYDSDHIAGIIKIVKHFGNNIKMIWVHKPTKNISEAFDSIKQSLNGNNQYSFLTESLRQIQLTRNDLNDSYSLILESLNQLNTLISLIREHKIPHEQPFANECFYEDWPELLILGPSRIYFDSIFNADSILEMFAKEYHLRLDEAEKPNSQHITNPCESLLTNPNTAPSNLGSVILQIKLGNKKLLFTGDAGAPSLRNAIGYPESIANLTFLKIPHHGSKNNITKELIEIMNPKLAFNSGDRHEDESVIGCLQSKIGCNVQTTKSGSDLPFFFSG